MKSVALHVPGDELGSQTDPLVSPGPVQRRDYQKGGLDSQNADCLSRPHRLSSGSIPKI